MEKHSQLRQLWSVVRSILSDFSFSSIKTIVGLAGADLTALAHLEQSSKNGATKGQLLSKIDTQVSGLDEVELKRFLCTVCERALHDKPDVESSLLDFFGRLGWTFHGGEIVEVQVFDPAELPELPSDSHTDLMKSVSRFRDGDLSGAVTSACAAVDAVTSSVYNSKNLGNPSDATFQERVSRAFKGMAVADEIERQLVDLGWSQQDAKVLAENTRGAINQAANVMQGLRSKMGDVHGTKPILKPLVFDSIKWAVLTVRLLG